MFRNHKIYKARAHITLPEAYSLRAPAQIEQFFLYLYKMMIITLHVNSRQSTDNYMPEFELLVSAA